MCRYGLIGRNGVGKSTLLRAIHSRELPIPENVNIVFVEQECAVRERSTQCVWYEGMLTLNEVIDSLHSHREMNYLC